MNKISVITPPDIIYNKNYKIFLICGSPTDRAELQEIIAPITNSLDIYLLEDIDAHHIDWLLSVHKICDLCIINFDQLPVGLKLFQSYLISFSNTYWITQGEFLGFNKISNNRIYSIKEISSLIGENVEV